jgi:exonuclease SbcC
MIIRTVQLKNFQGYADETITLHPHFNVFIGTGHAGKSSIIRALSFILYGIWNSKWVRWNEDFAEVSLTTDDGYKVVRQKGEKTNKYVLTTPEGKSQTYENFGKNVPEEIESVLKIFRADIGGKEELLLNLSAQHDPLFLLSQPGSFKAKVLGKLSGGHFLDYALKEINKDKKNLSGEKHLKEMEIVEIEKQLVSYRELENEKKLIDDIGIRISQTEQRMRYVEQLRKLFDRVKAWKEHYLQEIEEEKNLSAFSEDITKNLFTQVDKVKNLKAIKDKLGKLDSLIQDIQKDTTYNQDNTVMLIEKYFDLLKQNKKCPTCFTDINEHQLEKVKENL